MHLHSTIAYSRPRWHATTLTACSVVFLFGGIFVPLPNMPKGWKWMQYADVSFRHTARLQEGSANTLASQPSSACLFCNILFPAAVRLPPRARSVSGPVHLPRGQHICLPEHRGGNSHGSSGGADNSVCLHLIRSDRVRIAVGGHRNRSGHLGRIPWCRLRNVATLQSPEALKKSELQEPLRAGAPGFCFDLHIPHHPSESSYLERAYFAVVIRKPRYCALSLSEHQQRVDPRRFSKVRLSAVLGSFLPNDKA